MEVNAKVIFTGSKDEFLIIQEIANLMKSKPVIAVGETSLNQLVALIEVCNLFISNDTGPMHISAAMDTPTIGFFGPNSPQRYRPFGAKHIALYGGVHCSPCINIHYGQPPPKCKNSNYMECMKCITIDDVWGAIKTQLDNYFNSL